jgi:hypothetical protein
MKQKATESTSKSVEPALDLPAVQTGGIAIDAQRVVRFLMILLQLVTLAWLTFRFDMESALGLPRLVPYALGCFVVHAALPRTFQPLSFLLFSLGGIFWLMDWVPALVFVGLFALFFGILQLPFSVRIRAILLALAGAALAYIWSQNSTLLPDSTKLVPIVGSIFMFRASVYLYDIRFEKTPLPILQQAAYFLMLPNFVFTLFPVVDYKVFGRSYFSKPSLEIYQQGTRWMVRGFFHLMLYRVIYYYVQPSIAEATDLPTFAFYALTSYLLILRLSGLFHYAIGMLCLFGYNLPPVFHNYFFATGFSDLWRRINIYWRDYIMKVFYYPVYFKLRNIGKISGMVVSILVVFGITWMLHSYQWFWLKGSFPLRLVDGVFWGIFGILVAASSVYQQIVPKKKRMGAGRSYWAQNLRRTLSVVGMLIFMSFLWSFWNSPSVGHWWEWVTNLARPTASHWLQIGSWIITLGVLLYAGFALFDRTNLKKWLEPNDGGVLSVFWSGLTLAFFTLLCMPGFLQLFQPLTDKPAHHIYSTHLTAEDDAQMIQGYYEDILITNQLTNPLADLQEKPEDWVGFPNSELANHRQGWPVHDLLPSIQTTFKGASTSTNSWGMRDKDCDKEKAPGTFRIGILGGSYVMGSGIADEYVFDEVLEQELNQRNIHQTNYEILNFSVPGYHLMELTYRYEQLAKDFDLDAIIIVTHGVDFIRAGNTVIESYQRDYTIDLPFVERVLQESGLTDIANTERDRSQYHKLGKPLVEASYAHIGKIAQEEGTQPILLLWPRTKDLVDPLDVSEQFEMADSQGFINLNLAHTYIGRKREDIVLAPFDQHPNKLGHQLIADALLEEFISNQDLIDLIQSTKDE